MGITDYYYGSALGGLNTWASIATASNLLSNAYGASATLQAMQQQYQPWVAPKPKVTEVLSEKELAENLASIDTVQFWRVNELIEREEGDVLDDELDRLRVKIMRWLQ